tara:strand:- start:1010 stop:3643 length:2634 start_codon:yes stop_codon:yes gene_type:complete
MSILNNTSYKTLFHNIHCILRAGESALTGMAALNEINNFILFIFIEPRIDKIFGEGNNNIKFSYLVKKYIKKSQVDNQLNSELQVEFDKIIDKYYDNEYLMKYLKTDTTRTSVFIGLSQDSDEELDKYTGLCQQLYDIIKTCKDFFFQENDLTDEYIKQVFDNIDFDMLGEAYEKFKEDEVGNQGKTTGQYFTPRTIIKYCIEELIKPGAEESTYDSSCGTGGFIHYLDKYVSEYDPENCDNFKKHIYGNDKTLDVMKPLFINLLLHNIGIDNIKNRNSLSKLNCKELFEFFDICVGNPPFGVKNKIKYSDFNKLVSDDFNYWPSFLKTSGGELIKDSMCQFLIHVINSLKVGGRFCLVVDRGILNNGTESNSWQKKLRKWFLTCCDLKELILLPKGIFAHTMFDTAIIYGVKKVSLEEMSANYPLPSTQNVKVYEGEFINKKDRKGLKVDKENPNMELLIEVIVEKDWSLKYDDYTVKENISEEGIEYKTLGEVCEFKRGKPLTIDKMIGGDYQVIGGGIKLMENYYSKFNTLENQILISNDGSYAGYLNKFNKKLFITSHCNKCIIKLENFLNDYLFYFLKISYQNLLIIHENDGGFQKGNAQPSINLNKMYDIKIPILSPEHQQRIVDFMDEFIGEDYQKLDKLVSTFKEYDLFKLLIKEDYDTAGLAIEYINKVINFEGENRKFNELRKKCCFKTVPCEYKPLGEVCEFEFGKRITKGKNQVKEEEPCVKFPVYGGGGITFYTKNKNRNPGTLIISRFGVSPKCVRVIDKEFFLNDSGLSIKKYLVDKTYLVKILMNYQDKIFKFAEGQAQKNMNTVKLFRELIIPVPSLEDQQKVVDMIEDIDKEDSQYNQMLDSIKDMIETVYKSIDNITA